MADASQGSGIRLADPFEDRIPEYHHIVREERHFAAILFHLMQDRGRLAEFLQEHLEEAQNLDPGQIRGVYFEYSALRDIWHSLDKAASSKWDGDSYKGIVTKNAEILSDFPALEGVKEKDRLKLGFILSMLGKIGPGGKGVSSILTREIELVAGDSNATSSEKVLTNLNKFCRGGGDKGKSIWSPSSWSDSAIARVVLEEYGNGSGCNELIGNWLLPLLKFKWSFNIKPDIVIRIGESSVVCMELKLESDEGKYTVNLADANAGAWKSRFPGGIPVDYRTKQARDHTLVVRQLDMQRFMMKELLGFKNFYPVTVTKERDKKHLESDSGLVEINWTEAFEALALKGAQLPDDIEAVIKSMEALDK